MLSLLILFLMYLFKNACCSVLTHLSSANILLNRSIRNMRASISGRSITQQMYYRTNTSLSRSHTLLFLFSIVVLYSYCLILDLFSWLYFLMFARILSLLFEYCSYFLVCTFASLSSYVELSAFFLWNSMHVISAFLGLFLELSYSLSCFFLMNLLFLSEDYLLMILRMVCSDFSILPTMATFFCYILAIAILSDSKLSSIFIYFVDLNRLTLVGLKM